MSKRILFRLHGKHAEREAKHVGRFIKDYFSMLDRRVKLSIQPFEMFPTQYTPFDLLIDTANDEAEHIAHAAGWSYLQGIEQARGLFDTASTTFHDNPKLAEALKRLEIHYTGHPD